MTSPHDDRTLMPLSPHALLTGQLPAALVLWEQDPTPERAQAILALWAGLRRLRKAEPDPDEERLDVLVRIQSLRLVELACAEPVLDTDDWLRRVSDLDLAWDAGEEDPEELDWQAHELFEALDRAALAAWAVDSLAGRDAAGARLAREREATARAEEFLAMRVDLFICLATDVAAVLSSVRPGLEDDETALWETLLKHRRIEEARDELETPPDQATVLAAVREAAPAIRPIESDLDSMRGQSNT